MKTILRCLFWTVLTPAFYASLFLCAEYGFTGAGEGTEYFARIVLSPAAVIERLELLGVALWATFGLLIAFRNSRACRAWAVAALVAHYIGIIVLTANAVSVGESYNIARVWRFAPLPVVLFLFFYLASQVLFWVMIAGRQSSPRPSAPA
jgi:hypothetical protein